MKVVHLVVPFAALLCDCRCRTQYAPGDVTSKCVDEGYKAAIARDAGNDPLAPKNECEKCCSDHGWEGVDPGPCECGKLGLDVLLK